MSDGLHVRVRWDKHRDTCHAEIWEGDAYLSPGPAICYTEEQAVQVGEDFICLMRAYRELRAMGEPDESAGLCFRVAPQ